jgi:virulence-associated protein VapD
MLKVEIKMNEDKIVKEKVYDLDNVYETLDTAFAQFNLPKISKGIYTNGNSKYDYAHLWSVIWDLTEEKWFMDNVSDFIWYNSDIGENEADFSVEDILEYCQSHKIGTCV